MQGRILAIALVGMLGCSDAPEPVPTPTSRPAVATSFDAANTGTIRGRVGWVGDVPTPTPLVVTTIAFHPTLYKNPVHCTLPHYPRVQPENRGVSGAVVFLRSVSARASKPWDHGEVRVEFQDRALRVYQDKHLSDAGFVKAGSNIDIVSRDAEYHLLRARGAAFFTAPLQKPNEVGKRTLSKPGVVDLTSGAGYYWLHGHLFVAEHPYYTQTDAAGRFTLDQVPAGTYELVCWMSNWTVTRRERDPETGVLVRLLWAPPCEQTQTVRVRARESVEVEAIWSADRFLAAR